MTIDSTEQASNTLREFLIENNKFELVYQTQSGLDALSICDDMKPDIVIIDTGIRDISQFDFVKKVWEKYSLSFCECILLTMSSTPEWLQSFFEVQARHVLGKPLDHVELENAINRAYLELQQYRDENLP